MLIQAPCQLTVSGKALVAMQFLKSRLECGLRVTACRTCRKIDLCAVHNIWAADRWVVRFFGVVGNEPRYSKPQIAVALLNLKLTGARVVRVRELLIQGTAG